jgi:hypothetical protein
MFNIVLNINILAITLLLFISCNENPPTETSGLKIEGKVTSIGGPLSDAVVKLSSSSSNYSRNTNEFGEFTFTNVEPDTYTLSATKNVENQEYSQILGTDINKSSNLGDLTFDLLSFIEGNVDLLESEDDRLAEVLLLGTGINALTDSRGNYKLLFIPPGIYDIVVRKEGYFSEDSIAIEIAVNEIDTVNFELRPIIASTVIIEKVLNVDRNVLGIAFVNGILIGSIDNEVFTIDTLTGTTETIATIVFETYTPAISDLVYYPDHQLIFCRIADFSPYSYYLNATNFSITDSTYFSTADMQGAFYSDGYLYATDYDTDEIRNRVIKFDAFNPSQFSYLTTVDSLDAVYDMMIWEDNIILATGKHNGKNMFAILDRHTFSVLSKFYIPENSTIYRIEKINNALWVTNGSNSLIKFNIPQLN